MRGAALDFVEQAEDMRFGEPAKAPGERTSPATRGRDRAEQALKRAILAEEQQFVLAAEVVIQIARRQVGGHRDVAHPGGGKAAGAEHAAGGAQDVDAARVGAA